MSAAHITARPMIGQAWPGIEGSVYAGIASDKTGAAYALVVLADKPAQDLDWNDAMAWAKSIGADLPSRVDGALLFANVSEAFAKVWHWTNEQYSDAYAWSQYFDSGGQDYGNKKFAGAVRAVRRFPLESFNPSTKVELDSDLVFELRHAVRYFDQLTSADAARYRAVLAKATGSAS